MHGALTEHLLCAWHTLGSGTEEGPAGGSAVSWGRWPTQWGHTALLWRVDVGAQGQHLPPDRTRLGDTLRLEFCSKLPLPRAAEFPAYPKNRPRTATRAVSGGPGSQPPRTHGRLANSAQRAPQGFTEPLVQPPMCSHKRFGGDAFPLPSCLLGKNVQQ